MTMSYKLPPVKLSDSLVNDKGELTKKVQLLRVGEFYKGNKKIPVTKKDLESMVINFKEKVRGIDISIDYAHDSEYEAAAWVHELMTENNGQELWATVEWTTCGESDVKGKKYRYISADFDPDYKDNENLKSFGPTLLGAGLTNRPVVKRMEPITLSDAKGDNAMDKEKELADMKKENEKLMAENKALKEKYEKEEKEKKLAEEKAAADKKLSEEKEASAKKLSEKKSTFDKLLSEGKAVEAQREPFMADNFVEFVRLQSELKLSEKGTGTDGGNDKKDTAVNEVTKLADKMVKDEKITFAEAASKILDENPELRKKYEKETSY